MRLIDPQGDLDAVVSATDTVEIELDDLPGAGYLWSLSVVGPVTVDDPEYEPPSVDQGVGASARRTWVVVPRGPGSAEVRGRRGQAWDVSQTDRAFRLTLTINE